MRWKLWLGLTLALAACRETVVLDEGPVDGGGIGVDGGPTNCGPPVAFTPRSPKVMVALDRSDSMTEPFGYSTALAIARNALETYATRYQNAVWFGYLDFPGGSSPTCSSQTCCPGAISPPNRSLQGFREQLTACDFNQSCGIPTGTQQPTAAALSYCDFIFDQTEPNQYVLLITNGRPDCGTGPTGGSCGDGGGTQNVIAGLFSKKNVRTYVVAPGQGSDSCFHDLAVAGGTQDDRSPQDPFDLDHDIEEILHQIAITACEVDLTEQIRDPARVEFEWNGMQIPPPNRNGGSWELGPNGYSIILHGQSCDHLIDDGTAAFKLYTACPLPPRP